MKFYSYPLENSIPPPTLGIFDILLSVEEGEANAIGLAFADDVLVTKTYFRKFNFTMFLSEIGGSMGLWLGLGLLQALSMSINFVISWSKK